MQKLDILGFSVPFIQHMAEIKSVVTNIYNSHGGADSYITIRACLAHKGYRISRLTVHKYILNSLKYRHISNGSTEGFNNKIRVLKIPSKKVG